jgi:hypothetical protein
MLMSSMGQRDAGEKERCERRREELNDRIRENMNRILKQRRWTANGLAVALGEPPTSVWRWLENKATMPAWFVAAFCETLTVEPAQVVKPEGVDSADPVRRQALEETATLMRQFAHHLDHGIVPTIRNDEDTHSVVTRDHGPEGANR